MHSLTFVFLWSLDQIPDHVSLYFQVEILFQSKHQRQNLLHVPFLHYSTKKLYEYIVLWKRIIFFNFDAIHTNMHWEGKFNCQVESVD
jgi:hypothetical protein